MLQTTPRLRRTPIPPTSELVGFPEIDPDQKTMEHNAGLDSDLGGDSGVILEYHPAPDEEPDEPLSTWLEPQLNLRSSTSPRDAADQLRAFYTAEWIADLLVCLLSRTARTEATSTSPG